MSHEPGYSEPEYDAVYYSYYNQLWKMVQHIFRLNTVQKCLQSRRAWGRWQALKIKPSLRRLPRCLFLILQTLMLLRSTK